MFYIQLIEEDEDIDYDFAELFELFFDLIEKFGQLLALKLPSVLFHEKFTRLFNVFFLLINELFY